MWRSPYQSHQTHKKNYPGCQYCLGYHLCRYTDLQPTQHSSNLALRYESILLRINSYSQVNRLMTTDNWFCTSWSILCIKISGRKVTIPYLCMIDCYCIGAINTILIFCCRTDILCSKFYFDNLCSYSAY